MGSLFADWWSPGGGFMPHGHCYLWTPGLVTLEVATNASIGLAYLAISATLAHLVRRIRDIPFQWVFVAFGVFIVTCGFTHFMDVLVIWQPYYWVDSAVRVVTAGASVLTAILLVPMIPRVLALSESARLAHERGVKLEQMNRELEALYLQAREAIAEAIPQLVFVACRDGHIDFYNQRWFEVTGARPARLEEWQPLVHPEDWPALIAQWASASSTDGRLECELRLRRPADSTWLWMLVRAVPLHKRGDVAPRWVGTCTDIDERKQLEVQREALNRDLEEAVRRRDVFLAMAAHELRTPLTPLLLDAERLAHREVPDGSGRAAQRVRRQLARLNELVETLLDTSRIAMGRLELQRAPTDLGEIARSICERHLDSARLAGVELTVRTEPAPGVWDRPRLEQVVANLLTNAIRYGGGKPVEVEVTSGPGVATLRVRDQGMGIAPSDHDRIFRRFERVSSEKYVGGLGLGLWIVRGIVDEHGGTVRLESEPGKGATFIVELPTGT